MRRSRGPAALTGTAVAFGVVLTLVVVAAPALRFAYRSLAGHLVLETFDGCAAGIIALLFYGRARRTHDRSDFGLTLAFLLLTVTSGYLAVLPVFSKSRNIGEIVWLPLIGRLIAATLVALAAAVSGRAMQVRERDFRRVLVAVLVTFASLVAAAAVFGDRLPVTIDPTLRPDSSTKPFLGGAAVVLIAQIAHAALYGFAAVAFTRRAVRTPDPLVAWLGAGCGIAMMARVDYVLFPSIYSEWLYAGDLLRTAFYVMLIIGGVRELQGYWRVEQEAAVFAERRRIARDLHDGTIQELGYIQTLARQLSTERAADERGIQIVSAAERALAEARHALAALTTPADEPLERTIRRAAEEVADRYDVPLRVTSLHPPHSTPTQAQALVRIVREAVLNAVRHGRPSYVELELDGRCIRVRDDGTGFDVARHGASGFGLVSMTDRAQAVHASLCVESQVGKGTTVQVSWDG